MVNAVRYSERLCVRDKTLIYAWLEIWFPWVKGIQSVGLVSVRGDTASLIRDAVDSPGHHRARHHPRPDGAAQQAAPWHDIAIAA